MRFARNAQRLSAAGKRPTQARRASRRPHSGRRLKDRPSYNCPERQLFGRSLGSPATPQSRLRRTADRPLGPLRKAYADTGDSGPDLLRRKAGSADPALRARSASLRHLRPQSGPPLATRGSARSPLRSAHGPSRQGPRATLRGALPSPHQRRRPECGRKTEGTRHKARLRGRRGRSPSPSGSGQRPGRPLRGTPAPGYHRGMPRRDLIWIAAVVLICIAGAMLVSCRAIVDWAATATGHGETVAPPTQTIPAPPEAVPQEPQPGPQGTPNV